MLCHTAASAESANLETSQKLAADYEFDYYFTIEIMNRIYNDSLTDPDSPYYKMMYSEVSGAVSVHFIFAFTDTLYPLNIRHLIPRFRKTWDSMGTAH